MTPRNWIHIEKLPDTLKGKGNTLQWSIAWKDSPSPIAPLRTRKYANKFSAVHSAQILRKVAYGEIFVFWETKKQEEKAQ